MRATVFCVAVASLLAVQPALAQGSAPAVATAPQDSSQLSRKVAPSTDTLRLGDRLIAAGDSVTGPVLVTAGDLRVRGTVAGTAVVIAGDIIVESGGRITGDAIAALGAVRLEGGAIGGTARAYSVPSSLWFGGEGDARAPAARRNTRDAMSLTMGWLVVLLLIGIGVLVFAGNYLEGVSDVLEESFWRSFLVGVAGELAVIPVLVLLIVSLAITVVGILLIPFAVVAYVLAIAGLVTLGFLAMARLTGGSVRAGAAQKLRAPAQLLRGLLIGIVIYLGLWVVAAAFQWSPVASGILRAAALAITYVAATAGFGAAILSRGGSRRDTTPRGPAVEEMAVWQTPTPVTGVVAARRPTPAAPKERV